MGIKTDPFGLYLADKSEFVDVTLQFNQNLDVIDRCYHIPNFKVVNQPFNTITTPEQYGVRGWYPGGQEFMWWNGYHWNPFEFSKSFRTETDPQNGWFPLENMFINGWRSDPDYPALYKRRPTEDNTANITGSGSGAFVELQGKIQLNNKDSVPQGTYNFLNPNAFLGMKPNTTSWACMLNSTFRDQSVGGKCGPIYMRYEAAVSSFISLQFLTGTFPNGNARNTFSISGMGYYSF